MFLKDEFLKDEFLKDEPVTCASFPEYEVCECEVAMNEDCLFCKIINKDIPADIVYEDDKILAFRDINPQAPVHILIIPHQHISTINDVSEDDKDLLGYMVIKAAQIAKDNGVDESGYRLVINCNEQGGQTVFHIHLHILAGRQLTRLG